MQVAILCGGTGTRLKEQTEFTPKPLIQIGGKPMIYHIMRHYAKYGFHDFILALGYKQEAFKSYFSNYINNNYDIMMDITNSVSYRYPMGEIDLLDNFSVMLADTGETTLKGGRIKRIEQYSNGETFMLTYGDAVSDVNISSLLDFHRSHGKMVTITGVHPKPRFGEILHVNGRVTSYREKPGSESLVNGGFMVCEPDIFKYLDTECDFEHGPLERIAAEGQVMVYKHEGFWQCMDTLSDMLELQKIWELKGK
jgi:glucose-1-phosphate cytidylyltransferase